MTVCILVSKVLTGCLNRVKTGFVEPVDASVVKASAEGWASR